jgi:hypothetical protein
VGELDDLDAAGTGVADEPTEELEHDELGDDDPSIERGRARFEVLDRVLERLDLMDDLDSLQGGGIGSLATGVEIFGEQLAHGPYDDLLDAFEPVRDIADHTDLLDDLF